MGVMVALTVVQSCGAAAAIVMPCWLGVGLEYNMYGRGHV